MANLEMTTAAGLRPKIGHDGKASSTSAFSCLPIMYVLVVLGALYAFAAPASGEIMTDIDVFPTRQLDDAQAEHDGYERKLVDLGAENISFSAYLPREAEVNVQVLADALTTPGRQLVATIYAPQARNEFMISVVAFSPGFHGYPFSAGENLLFERGFELNDSLPFDPESSQSFGMLRSEGQVLRGARVFCSAREAIVLCFFAEFDLEHAQAAMDHAAVFGSSIEFEDEEGPRHLPDGVRTEVLPLPDGTEFTLRFPSVWNVTLNGFADSGEPEFLAEYAPSEDGVEAFFDLYVYDEIPPSEDVFYIGAANALRANLALNPEVFGDFRLLEETRLPSPGNVQNRLFLYAVETRNSDVPFRVRVAIFVVEGLTYVVLFGTNHAVGTGRGDGDYSAESFGPRWLTTTTESMVFESISRIER